MAVRILIGDCRERMKELPDASVDSAVCDPPYELGFMGKAWDNTGVANDATMWREVLRVLKPGGHLVAFSGTRTYHRMVCAIEDAGFEIRDMICWHYGSGFPKSHDVAKAITAQEKHGGSNPQALRKARQGDDYEPTGQEDYRKGRAFSGEIEHDRRETELTEAARQWQGWGTALKPSTEPICLARKPLIGSVAQNVLTHGTGAINIDGCRIEGAADANDRANKQPRENDGYGGYGSTGEGWTASEGRWPANLCHDGSDEVLAGFPETAPSPTGLITQGGQRSAARFFYCAKATTEERGEGNDHPTVKPVALMRWLVRLVTPKGGTVLDPFMGSGSTGLAAEAEQVDFVGIEQSREYADMSAYRIRHAAGLFADITVS